MDNQGIALGQQFHFQMSQMEEDLKLEPEDLVEHCNQAWSALNGTAGKVDGNALVVGIGILHHGGDVHSDWLSLPVGDHTTKLTLTVHHAMCHAYQTRRSPQVSV